MVLAIFHSHEDVSKVTYSDLMRSSKIVLISGFDNRVIVWDVGEEEPLVEVNLADVILSASFSYDGCRFVTSTKDKKFRVIDARKGDILQVSWSSLSVKSLQISALAGNYHSTDNVLRLWRV